MDHRETSITALIEVDERQDKFDPTIKEKIWNTLISISERECKNVGTGSGNMTTLGFPFLQIQEREEEPFSFPIEEVFLIRGRGIIVQGFVFTGFVKENTTVEIIGDNKILKFSVSGIEMYRKQLHEAKKGEEVALMLRGLNAEDVHRGQIVCKPGSISMFNSANANVWILSEEQGGGSVPLYNKSRIEVTCLTWKCPAFILSPDHKESIPPGEFLPVQLDLLRMMPIKPGFPFKFYQNDTLMGYGLFHEGISKPSAQH